MVYNFNMNSYTDILREHNLKVTPQRLAIAEAIDAKGHMSLDELYGVMLKKFSSISLATIYKNINIMLENAFIQEVKLPQAKSVYELTKEAHAHLCCKVCGSVEDIELHTASLVQEAQKNSQFAIEGVHVVLNGVCKKCQ